MFNFIFFDGLFLIFDEFHLVTKEKTATSRNSPKTAEFDKSVENKVCKKLLKSMSRLDRHTQ